MENVDDASRIFLKISSTKTKNEIEDYFNGLHTEIKDKLKISLELKISSLVFYIKTPVEDLGNNEFSIFIKVRYTGETDLSYIAKKQRQDIVIDKVEKILIKEIQEMGDTILTTHLCYRHRTGVNK